MIRAVSIWLCVIMAFQVAAQDIKQYPTRDGMVGVSIYFNDTLLTIGSKELRTVLDLETREILILLDPSTLQTGIDTLDERIRSSFAETVRFKGVIDSPYPINMDQHRTESFDVNGDLTINGIQHQVTLQATFTHRDESQDIGSMLYVHYDGQLADFGLDEKLPAFAEVGCVEILQAVLKPANQR